MKKIIFLWIMLSACISNVYCQDTIVLRNGDLVKSKVMEITQSEIKYKKFENLNGPLFNILKSEVLQIKYENGTKDYFDAAKQDVSTQNQLEISNGYYQGTKKLTLNEFKNILKSNPKAYQEFNSGKTLQILGTVVALPGAGLVGWSIGSGEYDASMLIAGGLSVAGGLLIVLSGDNLVKTSLKTYNKKFGNISYNLNINSTGIGIALRF